MNRRLLGYCTLAMAVTVAGCDLEVVNPNSPETERVIATPNDLEALLGSYYRRWDDGLYRNLGSVWGIVNVQSFENYSSLANNAQNARAGIPRPANDNSIGNVAQGEQSRVYFVHSEVTRVAVTILQKLNEPGYSLGTSVARDLRAKAFAEYLRGVSLGYLALIYDSAAVVDIGSTRTEVDSLLGYRAVADSALAALQRAIVLTTSSDSARVAAGATDGFPLPGTWIPSPTSFTAPEFIKYIRSFRARIRANLARTPTEGAHAAATLTTVGTATDWNQVIADAQAGITADFSITTDATAGPFKTWVSQYYAFSNWHQMQPFFIGMADTSGSYAAWIAQPLDARGVSGPFTMNTPDLRFPQGDTRTLQTNDFLVATCETKATTCKRYFRNRPPGNDNLTGLTWGQSQYDNARFWSWNTKGDADTRRSGKILAYTLSENRLLEAEGHIRLGNYATALPLINASRTAPMAGGVAVGGGLPAALITGVAPAAGNACVPKVPVGAANTGGGTVVCATDANLGGVAGRGLMEVLKYEKRLETHFTHFGAWFLDGRRWGDLAATTPLHFATPYQDLQARLRPIYSIGSGWPATVPGGAPGATAPVSVYGW